MQKEAFLQWSEMLPCDLEVTGSSHGVSLLQILDTVAYNRPNGSHPSLGLAMVGAYDHQINCSLLMLEILPRT